MKFSSGTKGIINASNNAIGVNEHIINFSNDKGSVILKGKDQDWITGFKVYLTDNQKLTQKKRQILISRFLPISPYWGPPIELSTQSPM